MKALKMLLWIPIGLVGVYLALMFYIYFNQDKMVFYPTDDFSILPDQLGIAGRNPSGFDILLYISFGTVDKPLIETIRKHPLIFLIDKYQ